MKPGEFYAFTEMYKEAGIGTVAKAAYRFGSKLFKGGIGAAKTVKKSYDTLAKPSSMFMKMAPKAQKATKPRGFLGALKPKEMSLANRKSVNSIDLRKR